MPTTIDFTKPIRQFNGHAANYIGQDRNGHAVIEAQFTDGTWSRACVWSPAEARHCFENIPAGKPKLEGFLEVYSSGRAWSEPVEFIHEEKSSPEMSACDGEAYWFTIDLAKVPDDAIVKVAP